MAVSKHIYTVVVDMYFKLKIKLEFSNYKIKSEFSYYKKILRLQIYVVPDSAWTV